jgi:hypothetical protein
MSLINHPGSDHQMAVIGIDAGHARDIMLMLADAHALISDLAGGAAPAPARAPGPPPGAPCPPPCSATPTASTPWTAWPARSPRP